jgi:hypothetical protein
MKNMTDAENAAFDASNLRRIDQLPDIDARYIVLIWDWDFDAEQTVIRYGDRVIFRHAKTGWEYWRYFIRACGVLKTKYGHRLIDIVPTPAVLNDICGDASDAPEAIRKLRQLIAYDCYPDPWDSLLRKDRRLGWQEFCQP